ncbi:hypothetical protein OS493_027158 [Desmophyllum pertusum]|uniref:Uncharacterized protein n=1 Tax=Desmophyllum pertusum TaxID=174260 RepID=A0A9W9ZYK0_9CNID|nr:hypothetical protein OS493_027158 [Desmophyllum pertusum]
MKGHKQVLEMLLKRVAGTGIIGKQNKDKNTPLHLAVERQRPQCVAMLLNSGAGTTLAQHQTPVELANGNKEIIDLLNNPDKAAEILPKKAKPAAAAEIGRGGSVKTDSLVPVQIRADNVIINQQYTTTVKNGNVAIGPGSQVVNAQDATANARPQPQLSGQSNYNANIEGGNASMGDYCVTNVGAGTPSKESFHRTERHAIEDSIPDGTLPAETVARATTPNGEALRPGDPGRAWGEHSLTVSSDNSSSGIQTSRNEDSTDIQVEDENPEDDLQGHKTCERDCYLM